MLIPFTKMHACGNDYIYINGMTKGFEGLDYAELAVRMAKRRFSVGADGLVVILGSRIADAKMRMFNADGSEGKMCGNAIRCVAKYLYDKKIARKTELVIETASGARALSLTVRGGAVTAVSADMGEADFSPSAIPVLTTREAIVDESITLFGNTYRLSVLSVGNPHAVLIGETNPFSHVEKIGRLLMTSPLFPAGINTEFVRVLSRNRLKMRVWERGSGETPSCGTGASAAASAAVRLGLCDFDTPISVIQPGGILTVTVDLAYRINLSGDAVTAYEGVFDNGASTKQGYEDTRE